jgi:hypothetical protein
MKSRIRIAGSLMVGVLALLAAAQASAAARTETYYACQLRQRLVVSRSSATATVQFIDRTYELRRKPSSIAEKYVSDAAVLIIEGPSAFFVAEDRLQLGTCVEAIRIAPAA